MALRRLQPVQDRCVGAVVLGAVEEEALAGRSRNRVVDAPQQPAALGQTVCHPVADHEVTMWSRAPVIDQSPRSVDPAQDEGDVWPHGSVEKSDVLDGLAVRAHLGVDLPAAAEDRNGPQVSLAIDPVCPQLAIRLEEAEADIRDSPDPGFHELVVDSYPPSL